MFLAGFLEKMHLSIMACTWKIMEEDTDTLSQAAEKAMRQGNVPRWILNAIQMDEDGWSLADLPELTAALADGLPWVVQMLQFNRSLRTIHPSYPYDPADADPTLVAAVTIWDDTWGCDSDDSVIDSPQLCKVALTPTETCAIWSSFLPLVMEKVGCFKAFARSINLLVCAIQRMYPKT